LCILFICDFMLGNCTSFISRIFHMNRDSESRHERILTQGLLPVDR